MCEDEAAEGSGWVELQVDPSGYSARFGGVHAVLDGVLSAAADASESTGVGVGVIVASSRVRVSGWRLVVSCSSRRARVRCR